MTFSLRNSHFLGFCTVVVAAVVLVAVPFWFVLKNPNDYFFLAAGDGIQSYFATAYYALYDHGLHFTGMNYPNGEHILYPNLQPSLALVMNLLQRCGIDAGHYTIAITNLVALAGLALAPVILYLILRRLRLPVFFSVLMALLIGFLSPQVDRLGGHMSLSYACFVPWLWYCIIRMQDAPAGQWRWYVVFMVSSLVQGLTMLYFLACGCFFLLAHVVVLSIQRRRPGPVRWRMLLAALLPLLLFRGWIFLTDPTTDRPPSPYGLLVYMATPTGLLMPTQGPFAAWWRQFTAPPLTPEDWSYVGFVSVLGLVATGVRLLVLGWRRRWVRWVRPALPEALRIGFPAAVLVLFLAMGLPFTLPGCEWLVNYIGPLKQLRALGRFAWPFYYVLGVYVAYGLYQLASIKRKPVFRWVLVPLCLLGWATEAWINISVKIDTVSLGSGAAVFLDPNTGVLPQLSWTRRKITDFQAILALPMLNLGSDKFGLNGSAASIYQSEKLALASGLPMVGSYVSRPSIGQVLRHVQLLSSEMIEKPLLKELPSAKPFLLLVTPEYHSPAEQRLIALAHLLLTTPEVSIYEVPVAALAATTLEQERAKAATLLPTLRPQANGLYCTSTKGVYLNQFADQPDRRGRLEPGAFYEPADAFSMLYDGPVPTPADTGRYEVSVWMNAHMDQSLGNLQVVQYASNQQVDHQVADGHIATEVDGDWLRVVVTIRVRPGTDRLQVVYNNQDLLVDDLMIRPLDTDAYYYTGPGKKQLVKNGYRL